MPSLSTRTRPCIAEQKLIPSTCSFLILGILSNTVLVVEHIAAHHSSASCSAPPLTPVSSSTYRLYPAVADAKILIVSSISIRQVLIPVVPMSYVITYFFILISSVIKYTQQIIQKAFERKRCCVILIILLYSTLCLLSSKM